MRQHITELIVGAMVITILLTGCSSPDGTPGSTNRKSVAWDTVKIKAAVDDYLKTHEKYYSLIDSISYWIDTLSPKRIAYDQSNYYTSIAQQTDRTTQSEIVIPPGASTRKIPAPNPNRFIDSANFYGEKYNHLKNEPVLGYRAFVRYRLSDVMLTYSDFTPYAFYFDTAYRLMKKSDFLHYTNIRLESPNESGVYLDTPYPYIPSKQ